MIRTSAFAQATDLGYFGITFDLCITIPFLYYLFVVRPGHAAPLSLVPVFVASLLIARAVVPTPHQEFLGQLWYLLIPVEGGVVIYIAFKVRAATMVSRGEEDILRRIEMITAELAGGKSRATQLASMELASIYVGLLGWWIDTPRARGLASTTFHHHAGWGSIVACIITVLAAEMIGVHLLLQQWSHTAAWVVTALELWGVLWLLGDFHAFRLRPFVVTEETIELRFGFRWTAIFPRALVTKVEPLSPVEAERLKETGTHLRLAFLDDPQHLIHLSEPIRVDGPFGITRQVTSIGLTPDDRSVLDHLA